MRVIVIGSGVIGVATAYFLQLHGHEVTVIDRGAGPGLETSFANGALLTPSMSDPWNSPGCWRTLLGSLFRSDAALQLRARALPALSRWGIAFLRNSRRGAFERNTLTNFRLALYSREMMSWLREHTQLDYGRTALGTLRIFRDGAALSHAVAAAEKLAGDGVQFRQLSAAETTEFEPALIPIANELVGALHYQADESGDAYRFCLQVAERARRLGAEFRFGVEVTSFERRAGGVVAALSGRNRFCAERYVVAAGSYSAMLLRHVGLGLPVRPAKGYSVTFEESSTAALRVPVIDDGFHAAIVPLERSIRVAGTAEFAGYDLTLRPARIRNLMRLLHSVLPQGGFDTSKAQPWCGLRPMSPDGVPIIGPTSVPNLFVNTGHGHLGWTMAAGSARLLADLVSERSPEIDPTPFFPARFAHA